jgi:beta-N-acetylhexosaminidase
MIGVTHRYCVFFIFYTSIFLLSTAGILRAEFVEEDVSGSLFSLEDFFTQNDDLDKAVDGIMHSLTNREKIAQMIMTSCGKFGRSPAQVEALLREHAAGGVVFQGVPVEQLQNLTALFRKLSGKNSPLYPLFSVDGEPSLISEKIPGIGTFPSPESMSSIVESRETAAKIAHILKNLGIHITFAPVCDLSMNNQVIGSRSFGSDPGRVSEMAVAFVIATQEQIAATAKHFPGHGMAPGDSHKKLVFVSGVPPEIPVFKNVINAGVVFVMVGHIGVSGGGMYDTGGLPATFSDLMIKRILKGSLGFKGIVITDSLNMDAVRGFPTPALSAVRAGCDMVLMPEREERFIEELQLEIEKNPLLKEQVMESVRKIIRLKLCFGLLTHNTLDKSGTGDDIN